MLPADAQQNVTENDILAHSYLKHECRFHILHDNLEYFLPGDSRNVRLKRWLKRLFLVTRTHPRTHIFFKSSLAVRQERDRHLKLYYNMIHPFSRFSMLWQSVMAVVLLNLMFLIPFHCAYDTMHEHSGKPVAGIVLVLNTICLVDIFINFRTGFVKDKREVVLERHEVAHHYLWTYFFIDIISSICWDFVYVILSMHTKTKTSEYTFLILQIPLLLKLARSKTAFVYLRQLWQQLGMSHVFRTTVSSFLMYAIFLHWTGCLNFMIAALVQLWNSKKLGEDSWLENELFYNHTLAEQYAKSLFRSVSHAFQVSQGGSRNIRTPEDIVMTLITQIIGLLVFFVLMTNMILLTRTMYAPKMKYHEMINSLKGYMTHKGLPHQLKKQLISYYEFRFQRSYFEESEILGFTSGCLKMEVRLHSCRQLVENVTFFRGLPTPLLIRIVACLQSEIFLANEVIVKVDTTGDDMYFIAAGTVAVYSPGGQEVCHLEDDDHFGEIALIMRDEQRVATVIAVETSELYRLDRASFQQEIEPYPELLARIEDLAKARKEYTQLLDEWQRRVIENIRMNYLSKHFSRRRSK